MLISQIQNLIVHPLCQNSCKITKMNAASQSHFRNVSNLIKCWIYWCLSTENCQLVNNMFISLTLICFVMLMRGGEIQISGFGNLRLRPYFSEYGYLISHSLHSHLLVSQSVTHLPLFFFFFSPWYSVMWSLFHSLVIHIPFRFFELKRSITQTLTQILELSWIQPRSSRRVLHMYIHTGTIHFMTQRTICWYRWGQGRWTILHARKKKEKSCSLVSTQAWGSVAHCSVNAISCALRRRTCTRLRAARL